MPKNLNLKVTNDAHACEPNYITTQNIMIKKNTIRVKIYNCKNFVTPLFMAELYFSWLSHFALRYKPNANMADLSAGPGLAAREQG